MRVISQEINYKLPFVGLYFVTFYDGIIDYNGQSAERALEATYGRIAALFNIKWAL